MEGGDSTASQEKKITFKVFENISNVSEIPESIKIRDIVFKQEQSAQIDPERDPIDLAAIHLIMYLDNEPIGSGRVTENDGKCYIGFVAIVKEHRGKSYGKILMLELTELAKRKGKKEVFIHAQLHAIPFYEKLGWELFGEEFIRSGIRHRHMSYKFEDSNHTGV